MKIIQMADDFVNRIGLGENIMHPPLPRHLRWLSLAALVALISGAAILLLSMAAILHGFICGLALYLMASLCAAILQYVGPLRRATAAAPLDERERALRTKAYDVTGKVVGITAMVGAWCMTAVVMFSHGLVTTPAFWWIVAWLLSGLFSITPSFYASWTTRPLAAEDA
jgi:hypothetical protein